MAIDKSSEDTQQKIDSILEQMSKTFPLPPSHLILRVTELALKVFAEKNMWTVPVTLESVFFNIIEFSKNQGIENESEEMRRSHLFAKTFLKNYQRQYSRISEAFIKDRNDYINQSSSGNDTPILEIREEAHILFDLAAQIAIKIFDSKMVKGEHLILSFFSSHLSDLQDHFHRDGIVKEKLLYEWIESLDLSVEELGQWQSAFSFIGCKVDVGKIVEEREAQKEKQTENTNPSLEIPAGELGRSPSQADEPVSEVKGDLLGRKHLVAALAEMVADENQGTPFTIGLLGRWGSGKSTVMRMLEDELKTRKDGNRFKFTQFNAWEYEQTNNLGAGLAQEVVSSLVEPLGFWEKWHLRYEFALREHGPKTLIPIAVLMLIILGLLGDIGWVVYNLYNGESLSWWREALGGGGLTLLSIKFWNNFNKLSEHPLSVELRTYLKLPNYGEHLGLIPVLKRHIQTLCKMRLGTAQEREIERKEKLGKWHRFVFGGSQKKENELPNRLVVFIDDLDRCDPSSISKTLDAVRLVMDVKNVIVILGIDHRIAFRAVGGRYKGQADRKHSVESIARDYLGKILQLVIVLNQPQEDELKSFVSQGLFPNAGEINSESIDIEESLTLDSAPQEKVVDNPVPEPLVETHKQTTQPPDEDKSNISSEEQNPEENFFEKIKEKKIWSEEIKFSTKERDLFGELAVVFEISVPRQLLRLRNSYGFLKLTYGMGNAIPFTPFYEDTGPKDLKTILMILLFWKEFEANHPKWAQQVIDPPKNAQREPIASIIADRMSQSDIGGSDFSLSGLTAIASFVGRFVLPHGEADDFQ